MLKKCLKYWHLAVVFVLIIFATTPKSENTECLEEIKLAKIVNFSFNCDSISLTNRLVEPERFFVEYHNWKGRPVYFTLGYVMGNVILAPTKIVKPFISIEDELNQGTKKYVEDSLHFYFTYFLMNILIVFLVSWCAIRLSGINHRSIMAAAIALAISSLDIVEAGTFLMHTNIMNLAVAIGAAMYFALGAQFHLLERVSIYFLGSIIGLGVLAYPAFILYLPAFILGLLYYYFVSDFAQKKYPNKKELLNIAIVIALTSIPMLIWANSNQYIFDTRTYLTLDKGQFQWIFESIKKPNFVTEISSRLQNYLLHVYENTKIELFLCLICSIAVLAAALKNKTLRNIPITDIPLLGVMVALLGVLSFNFLQGYYTPRMFYSIVALIYIGIIRTAYLCKCEKLAGAALSLAAMVQIQDAIFTYTTTGK